MAIEKGLRPSVSGFLVKNIFFLTDERDMLPLTDEERLNADLIAAKAVLSDLVKISERLSTNATYRKETPEDNINDFNLKFFLEIDYSNCTYLAIKGIHPFKQGNYQEIMKFFTKWIQP